MGTFTGSVAMRRRSAFVSVLGLVASGVLVAGGPARASGPPNLIHCSAVGAASYYLDEPPFSGPVPFIRLRGRQTCVDGGGKLTKTKFEATGQAACPTDWNRGSIASSSNSGHSVMFTRGPVIAGVPGSRAEQVMIGDTHEARAGDFEEYPGALTGRYEFRVGPGAGCMPATFPFGLDYTSTQHLAIDGNPSGQVCVRSGTVAASGLSGAPYDSYIDIRLKGGTCGREVAGSGRATLDCRKRNPITWTSDVFFRGLRAYWRPLTPRVDRISIGLLYRAYETSSRVPEQWARSEVVIGVMELHLGLAGDFSGKCYPTARGPNLRPVMATAILA